MIALDQSNYDLKTDDKRRFTWQEKKEITKETIPRKKLELGMVNLVNGLAKAVEKAVLHQVNYIVKNIVAKARNAKQIGIFDRIVWQLV